MDLFDSLTILAFISQITGTTIDKLNKIDTSNYNNVITLSTATLLSIFDDPQDDLVGLWSLNRWDYIGEVHNKYYVSGRLAILYKDSRNSKWVGTLFLRYQNKATTTGLIKPDGWIERIRGHCFDGIYSVELRRGSGDNYYGSSTQIFRRPEGLMHSGEFKELRLVDKGKLVGEFINTNTSGRADIAFHMRRRWHEIRPDS